MEHQKANLYLKIIITILIIVLAILCFFLVQQYRTISQQKAISAERFNFANLARHHSLGINEINLIEPWMTFNYVSISYKVPASYLQTMLGISSSTANYPNITINHYAKTVGTNPNSLVEKIKNAVQQYLAQPRK
jgi:hypothetical protein